MSAPRTGLDLLPIGTGILTDVGAFFAGNNVELPTRRYLAPGAPGLIAWDCEQLMVCLAAIQWGINDDAVQPAPQIGAGAGIYEIRAAQWSVQLVRCTPSMGEDAEPPAASVIHASGVGFLMDAGMLSQCLVNLAAFPGEHSWMPAGALAKAGSVVALGPQGNFHGFEGSFTITVTDLAAPNP